MKKIGDYTLREIRDICITHRCDPTNCPLGKACGQIFDYGSEPYYLSTDDIDMEVPNAEKDLL